MRFARMVEAVCLATSLLAAAACGDNGNANGPKPDAGNPGNPGDAGNPITDAPSALSYGQSEIVATVGRPITANQVKVTGTVTSFTASPALPAGLALDDHGVIAGTPTAAAAHATYTITATNSIGSTTTSIGITVHAAVAADPCRDVPGLPGDYATWPALAPAVTADPAIEAQIADLVSKMTLAQKVGQMVQGEIGETKPADVTALSLGSMLNGGGSWPNGKRDNPAATWRALADAYFDASPTIAGVKVPVLWGIDAVHGNNNVRGATVFPHNIGLGAAHDGCLAEQIGKATSDEVRATGQDWAFGPTLAVVRDDRWGRTYEGFSEDPAIVRWYGEAAFRGMSQLDADGKHVRGVLPTAKHFIGDGGTTDGVDQGNNQHSEAEMINIFGQGYYGSLGPGGGQTVMISFNSWNAGSGAHPAEGKAHGSKYLVTDVLKTQMKFDGLTVTDWNGHGQVAGCSNADCPQAVNAGIDLFMIPSRADLIAFIANVKTEVGLPDTDPKHIPMARIDDAVTRILRVKARTGLLGSTVKPSQRDGANDAGLLHRELARKAVQESMVLIKNEAVLPLARPTTKKILVVGNGMDSFGIQSGGWTISWQGADVTNADVPAGAGDTILAGIQATVGADKVDTFASAADVPANLDFTQYDAVIAVVGETPYAEGVGDITASQTLGHESKYPAADVVALLDAVHGHSVPVVTVLLSGRPLWVNRELNRSDAFVAAFLPGSEGGGVADVLFKKADGTVNADFSGRLSFSWPKSDCQTPLNISDPEYQPLFPYEYGLTYATAASTVPTLDETASTQGCAQKPVNLDVLPVHNNTGAIDPFNLYLGANPNFNQLVEAPGTALNDTIASSGNVMTVTGSSTLTVDLQGDGRRAVWTGNDFAQIYMQQVTGSQDLSGFLAKDGAMVFKGVLNEATTAQLTAQFTCNFPCRGVVDITALLKAPGEKTTFKLPLSCFVPVGTDPMDFTTVNAPFQLQTVGKLDFTFAEISWVRGAAKDADAAQCPTPGVALPAQ